MENKTFSLLLLFMFILGASLIIKNQEGFLLNENRNKTTISDIRENKLIESINNLLSDQMYFRDDITSLYRMVFQMFEVGEKRICLNRNYIIYDNIYLDNSYSRTYNMFLTTCANKAYNLNQISLKYPDIDMYVYNPIRSLKEPILDSVYFPDYNEKLEEEFLKNLGNKIHYDKMEYSNLELKKYFYRTDHHYNAYGADKAYKDIIHMIGENHYVGDVKNMQDIAIINENFYGYYFYQSGEKLTISDALIAGDYDLDQTSYDYYSNGKLITFDNEMHSNIKAHTYETYFLCNTGEIIFDYHDNNKSNILVISDSYIGPIKDVLSSHFNKSVFIYPYPALKAFQLDKTIKEYNIDIILVLQFHQNLYFSDYYFIPIN